MKIISLIILIMFSLTCFGESKFVQKDLGISFKYHEEMLFDFNPHAMRKTQVYLNGDHVGGFVVSSLPEGISIEAFLGVGVEWYKEKYPGAKVTMSPIKNQSGNIFYKVSAEFEAGGKNRLEEKYIFVYERDIGLGGKSYFTYTFTFLYPVQGIEGAKAKLFLPVNTMDFLTNKSYVNAAVKKAVGQ
jgi:hypothetical protein